MIDYLRSTLSELATTLDRCGRDIYDQPCRFIGSATIGQHTRHIIEMFHCLEKGYESGIFSYDDRERNRKIETELEYALQAIQMIVDSIDKPDKVLTTHYHIESKQFVFNSNYHRELLYNLEHCIHHEALIRVAIESMTAHKPPAEFGVAPSTLAFRGQLAE